MADDDPERMAKPQPSPGLPESVKARARELAGLGLGITGGADIGAERSAQLAPLHTPSNASSGGDQSDGTARARHPAEETAVPSVSELLRDPGRYRPPPQPPGHGPGHGRGRGMKR